MPLLPCARCGNAIRSHETSTSVLVPTWNGALVPGEVHDPRCVQGTS